MSAERTGLASIEQAEVMAIARMTEERADTTVVWRAGKTLGPTFADEVHAAGLAQVPMSFGADGLLNFTDATPEQIAAVKALVERHDPKKAAAPPPPSAHDRLAKLEADNATLLRRLVALEGKAKA